MLNKISILGIVIFLILQFSAQMSYAQEQKEDSTKSWHLIWEYDDNDIESDSVVYFDIYKGVTKTAYDSLVDSVSALQEKKWKDINISPDTKYYYWVKARNERGVSSDPSNMASAAIPYILETMDTIAIDLNKTIYLNNYAVDQDYEESQYKDSLSWWINDVLSYTSKSNSFKIEITEDDSAKITVMEKLFENEKVYFTVYDPDSFYYKKEVVIKYQKDEGGQPPEIPDSSEYDPTKETLVYPIPYRASINDFITFDNLPPGGTLMVFDMMGDTVFKNDDIKEVKFQWNVKNDYGRNVNAGLYIFQVLDNRGNKIDSGKVVVIR